MTLKQLEAFLWAARAGSFSVAATRLNVTQSTLSKRIAELEADLGRALFDRSGQRAALTDSGMQLLDHAAQMIELENRIRANLDAEASLRGTMRFGISELVASTWFPNFVARVRQRHPNLVLEPQVDLTRRLERSLERGELDFAIIPGPSPSTALSNDVLGELEYRWMAAPHRLPPGTLLTPNSFADHPVIMLGADSGLSRALESWAESQQIAFSRAVVCNSLSALIALVIAGAGISLFPLTYVAPLVRSGKLAELASPMQPHNLRYCFHWRSGDTRSLISTLRSIAKDVADFSEPSALWAA
ncbi:DNA-binding transcriptional regulator, LysR family [Cupriavidus sp. YR651]|uniref:LysR family transcriptional regulator n=1 Tax=Cupriavidus sp. YR651 TaxID=1855315 RepID=UPI0008822C92|nr:LysR family transcriptional regulator [Cupriavidus sp. YR651]SDD83038.1 DNA-binding transcriptional regulator, LysR family [Cupriavidus sp. YR651]